MKTKFTKASKKDKTLVTVSIGQFDADEDLLVYGHFDQGDELILVIDSVPTIFTVNRLSDKGDIITAATKCFPRHLRLPAVGRPTYAEVTEIR